MDRVAESSGRAPRAPGAEGEFGRRPLGEETERGAQGIIAVSRLRVFDTHLPTKIERDPLCGLHPRGLRPLYAADTILFGPNRRRVYPLHLYVYYLLCVTCRYLAVFLT
ncbi:hypothetical protein B0H19DRAFT_1381376 [Mycena capillaripes]|nr:hypothetical protein B0H19DRAFT_1381376 [Mycena capillaripes]